MSRLRCDNSQIHRARRGLTLLELVIVLVILAALTGIAVVSLEPIADQSRYDATQQTLENMQDAIITLPPVRRANGSLAIHGFVSDMGRLPFDLNELVVKRDVVRNYSVQHIGGNPANEGLSCGWRGPYLNVTDISNIKSGWGTDFSLNLGNTDPNFGGNVLDAIYITQPGTTNELTIPAEFDSGNTAINTLLEHAYVDVSVTFGTAPATVSLYIPDAAGTQLRQLTPDSSSSTIHKVFTDVPVGVRLVEATFPPNGSTPATKEYRYVDVVPRMAAVHFN